MLLSFKEVGVTAVVLIMLTFGVTRWAFPPEVVYENEIEQRIIDSLTVAKQNLVLSRDALLDSLNSEKLTSEAFRMELERSKGKIASYSRIIADLRVSVDSASAGELVVMRSENNPPLNPLPGGEEDGVKSEKLTGTVSVELPVGDSLLASSSFFGSGLLRSEAVLGFTGTRLMLSPPSIDVLRPVRIDVAVVLSENDGGRRFGLLRRGWLQPGRMQAAPTGVTTIVTSPDFENLRVESFTELKPTTRKQLPWFWVGVGVGLVGWEIVR